MARSTPRNFAELVATADRHGYAIEITRSAGRGPLRVGVSKGEWTADRKWSAIKCWQTLPDDFGPDELLAAGLEAMRNLWGQLHAPK